MSPLLFIREKQEPVDSVGGHDYSGAITAVNDRLTRDVCRHHPKKTCLIAAISLEGCQR